MGKMDAIAKGLHHLHQIVIGANAIRSGTHGEAIINAVHRLLQPLHIFDGRHDTRQARIGRGGSSGCTAADPYLFAYRHDGAQEIGHIFTQLCFINVVVLRQTRAELVKGVALFRSRQAGDDIASQFIDICFAHRLEIDLSLTLLFFTVIRFRSRAFKDMQLKGGESDLIETQRPGAVRQLIFQIGARPVEDRHKVVAHGIDAAGREVADALLIVGNPCRILPAVGFNILVDGNAFDDRPVNPFAANSA